MTDNVIRDLLTKRAFAARADVTPALISRETKPGKRLYKAMYGKKIDAFHPDARAFLRKQGKPAPDRRSAATHRRGAATVRDNRKLHGDELPAPPDPAEYGHIAEYLDLTLREVLAQFATDVRFVDWVKAVKEIENIRDKRLRNDEREGQYVPRDLVEKVLSEFERCFVLLLRDASKTVSAQVHAATKAGGGPSDSIETVQDLIGAPIADAKKRIARWLKDYTHVG